MHLPKFAPRVVRRRALVAALGAFVVLGVAVAPVAADEPIDLFEHEPTPSPQASSGGAPPRLSTPPRRSTAARTRTQEPAKSIGFDVSWPQCNDELPEAPSFAIVGVNRGRTFSQNDCFVEQLEWAGRDVDFYLNTGSPGPHLSAFWPAGQDEPRECDTGTSRGDDTHDCAYLYGWNAAADGYARALDAFIGLDWADPDAERIPGQATWWLDVETANSWRSNKSLNVATLRGAVDYLESMEVETVGFYSTPLLWWLVTRGTDAFEDYPAWHAGATSEAQAGDRCDSDAFTGGELLMVQWVEDGIDTNLICEAAAR